MDRVQPADVADILSSRMARRHDRALATAELIVAVSALPSHGRTVGRGTDKDRSADRPERREARTVSGPSLSFVCWSG
ncbi:hypothetical protein [Isoptericola sp. NPDC056605]|uniref:hypothetical protein n=1 Tax=Isoptericola sp. NPDC056605 TaxID=3345876 RepID=UPI00368BB22A